MPEPEILGRNGTYLGFRKLHSRVAAFRQYLRASAESPQDEEWLKAKMVGRWPSGAPIAVCPQHDDPALGADPDRNNAFLYYDDDPSGLNTPLGSHIRRSNPRDALKDQGGVVNLHRQQPLAPVRVRKDAVAQRWRIHWSGSGARCDCWGQ